MNKAAIAFGVILIVLGAVACGILLTPVSTNTIAAGEATTVRAGSSVPRIFHIPNDAYVSGTLSTVSGGSGDIDFYVFDKTNYDNWIIHQPNNRYVYTEQAVVRSYLLEQTKKLTSISCLTILLEAFLVQTGS